MIPKIRYALRRLLSKLYCLVPVRSGTRLVHFHFKIWSHKSHPNIKAFIKIMELLQERPVTIIETGTSAWGTDSTRLWARYVQNFGGELWSVDIRPQASERLKGELRGNVHLVISDSVEFLLSENSPKANVYFLDSWDVNWSDPEPSALHGLAEFDAIKKRLLPGDIIFIDDTPKGKANLPIPAELIPIDFENKFGVEPGKGALVYKLILHDQKYEILFHEYSLIFIVKEELSANGDIG